jgi:LmbE family N-acetylglucosaminyl deacetylase
MGGTLAHYAQHDTEITLVCATKGEVGEIGDPALATPETLGEVRQKELETACAILGIQHLEFLGYRDSGMDGTPENGDTRALVQADPDEVIERLVGLMRRLKPEVVVTFEPFGWYGHPDHQAAGRWATEAYSMAGDPDVFPEAGPAWQPARLYHAVIPFSSFGAMIQEAIAAGYIEEPGIAEDMPEEQQLKTEAAVTHVIDVGDLYKIKLEAMYAHRTQFSEKHMFVTIPPELLLTVMGQEHFIQVQPSPPAPPPDKPSSDLFAGL